MFRNTALAVAITGASPLAVMGQECTWDNGAPADCGTEVASQVDPVYPFIAEAADDFILVGDAGDVCTLTTISFWFHFFADDTPSNVGMSGVHVTIYADTANPSYDPNDPNSPPTIPDGEPINTGGHTNSVVEAFVASNFIVFTEINLPETGQVWRADMATDILVPRGENLWISFAPEFLFPPQSGIKYSEGNTGSAAVQFFNLLGIPWTRIPPIVDCPDVGVTANDVAFSLTGEPLVPFAYCPADCDGTEDQMVGVADLLALLAQWDTAGPCDVDGDGVGITDMLALLAAWGPCPVLPNDECADALPLMPGKNEINLSGATQSIEPVCTVGGDDAWYVYTAESAQRGHFVATVDVFMEIYDSCSGALIDCGPAQFGLGPVALGGFGPDCLPDTGDEPPLSVIIRLVNDNELPNGPDLVGTLVVTVLPANDPKAGCFGTDCEPIIDPGMSAISTTVGAASAFYADCGDATNEGTGVVAFTTIGDGTTYTASTCNPGTDPTFDTQISIYCGDCAIQLICVDGNNDDNNVDCQNGGFGVQSTISWCAEAGRKYYIVVHGSTGANPEGIFELSLESDGVPCDIYYGCGPENDRCVDAIPIFDGLTAFSTLLAQTDGPQDGDPNLCSPGNANPQCVHDIWYTYEAICDGFLTVDTCEDLGGSADFDTDIWIYGPYQTVNDIDCDHAVLNANVATCNDDGQGFPCGDAAPWHSVAQLPVLAGEIYLIRVGGWATEGGDLGTGMVQVTCAPPPVGACCIEGACTDDITEDDCVAQFGLWSGSDTLCVDVTCPECGGYLQPEHGPDDDWTFGTTDVDIDIIRYESFPWNGGDIDAIQFYGLDAFNDGGGFAECVEDPQVADVTFYADNAGAPGAVICTYDDLAMTRVDTGVTYASAFTNNQYTADLPTACDPGTGVFWVSVQGKATGDMCWLLWLSSPAGDGGSLREETGAAPGGFIVEHFDLSLCVNP